MWTFWGFHFLSLELLAGSNSSLFIKNNSRLFSSCSLPLSSSQAHKSPYSSLKTKPQNNSLLVSSSALCCLYALPFPSLTVSPSPSLALAISLSLSHCSRPVCPYSICRKQRSKFLSSHYVSKKSHGAPFSLEKILQQQYQH